jgi:hypothetical protein
MHQEASDELARCERHGLEALATFGTIVLPSESDAIGVSGDQPAVGNGDTVGMCASYLAQARGRMFGMLTKGGRPLIK